MGGKILTSIGILLYLSFGLTGVLSIQNARTSLPSDSGKLVLSASSYPHQERTANSLSQGTEVSSLHRTSPSLELASSKIIDKKYDREDGESIGKTIVPEEPIDFLTSSKHFDQIEGNNIEIKSDDYSRSISPTRSETVSGEEEGAPRRLKNQMSEPQKLVLYGLYNRKPQRYQKLNHQNIMRSSIYQQRRQSRQETSRIFSEHAPPPVLQTALPAAHGKRQANPDIQDIITGIVKLLNGNVNVAANTARPLRPIQATRINNRGPPRISDVPPLPPDFDTPGMNPPPPPDHPYPFEKPPAIDRPSVNQLPPERPVRPFINDLPEHGNNAAQGNRPGYENLWNRPHRPSATRRPIPPYKPLPPQDKNESSSPGFEKVTEKFDNKPQSVSRPGENARPSQSNKNDRNEYNEGSKRVATTSTTTSTTETPMSKSPPVGTAIGSQEKKEQVAVSDPINVQKSPQNGDSKPNYNVTTKKGQKYQQQLVKNDDNTMSQNTLVLGSDPLSYPIPNNDDGNNGNLMEDKTKNDSVNKNLEPSSTAATMTGTRVDIKPSKTSTTDDFQLKPSSSSNDDASITVDPSNTKNTQSIATSSSVELIEPTPTMSEIEPTIVPLNNEKEEEEEDFPKLEPSKVEATTDSKPNVSTPTEDLPITSTKLSQSPTPSNYYPYRPRPGIVLDDTLDYTKGVQGVATHRPYTGSSHYPQIGDIFDVTVSAIQGPGGSGESVRVSVNPGNPDIIVTSAAEGQGFVSIDGKRTYLNLFDNSESNSAPTETPMPQATRTQQSPAVIGTGYAVAQPDAAVVPIAPVRRPPPFHRRPSQPPVRIDTCIVGDSSTCDGGQHEACATFQGVSACHCKPGYARLQHSLPCKKTVSIVVSIRVDKIYDRKVVWDKDLGDKDSESYQTLAYEAGRAVESAMSMTPFSDEYMGSSVNGIYRGDVSQGQGGVFVNTTLKLTHESRTSRPSLAVELQKHLLGVIHRRNNNIGNSALYVESPPGSVSSLQDLDECYSSELNDCHSSATCSNNWGSFTCACKSGLKDPHKNDPNESGRVCLSCPATHCNNRGLCSYLSEEMQCSCTGNYYGSQCEIDGEVLGVAIGASVAALVIIILTLVCLVMWSRRWSREQKSLGSPVYGYMQGGGGMPGTLPGTLARVGSVGTLASGTKQGPPTGLPPYMWAHIADHMATANLYATEPMGSTRPSSAIFGYPTLGMHGTLPPVPLPRLQAPPRPRHRHNHHQQQQHENDSSDSEPQDRDRADLIPQNGGFHVPRPKSRSSVANQSGIYYDVEYDQGDSQHLSKNNIPMSTYSMARPYYRT